MSIYGDLFMQEYSHVYEKQGVSLEMTNFDYRKMLAEKDMKDAVRFYKDGKHLQRKKQYSDAIKKYESSIKKLNKCKDWVNKNVDNEDTMSWIFRLFFTPGIIAAFQIGRGDDMKHLTKSGCQGYLDKYIRSCQNRIADCKQEIDRN